MSYHLYLAISKDTILTSNQRLHWAVKARRTKAIRDMAFVMAKYHNFTPLKAADIEVEVTWPNRSRRRDSHNLQPSVKAAVDGFMDAGLLVDDSDQYLRSLTFTSAEETRTIEGVAAHLKFTITPAEVGSIHGESA